MDHVIALRLTSAERLLVVGPLYHVGGFDLPGDPDVLWMGGLLCVHREFDPVAAMESIERHRLTSAWMAPVMVGRILALPDVGRYDVSKLSLVHRGRREDARVADSRFQSGFHGGTIH